MCLQYYPPHGKTKIYICENKDADQLRSNCKADQRLCFHYTYNTIPLLLKSKVSSLQPASVLVQCSLCWTWSEPKLLVFSRTGSYVFGSVKVEQSALFCLYSNCFCLSLIVCFVFKRWVFVAVPGRISLLTFLLTMRLA